MKAVKMLRSGTSFTQGKYTVEEIDDMINNENYIPIASAQELYNIRYSGYRTMGVGTIWENTYNTGRDKKYVQVANISLIDYQSGSGWEPIEEGGSFFTGTYDGALLIIGDLYQPNDTRSSIFGRINNATIRNVVVIEPYINSQYSYTGVISNCSTSSDGSGKISNCHVLGGTIIGKSLVGGICGSNYHSSIGGGMAIEFCTCDSDITVSEYYGGGITGRSQDNYSIIKKCKFSGIIKNLRTDDGSYYGYGGIVGYVKNTTIFSCKFDGTVDIKRQRGVGGITGMGINGNVVINECESNGIVKGNTFVGGILGWHDLQTVIISDVINKSTVIVDCEYPTFNSAAWRCAGIISLSSSSTVEVYNSLAIGQITSVNTPQLPNTQPILNSFNNYNVNSLSNSYYCSQLTGQSTGVSGVNITVSQLRDDDIGSGIYASWNSDVWEKDENNLPKLKNVPL